jgi:hypothetical protein
LNAQAITKFGLSIGVNLTIGARDQMDRSANSKAATNDSQAAKVMRTSPNQSWRGPSSSTYSSAPRKKAIDNRCDQSILFSIEKSARSIRISVADSTVTAMPGTTLT